MEHILIVEDDPALGRGLVLALEGAARACTLASDCAGARRALAASSFDLAIFDINLPDGSGLTLLEETRAAGGPPVILLTARTSDDVRLEGYETGADAYITKPFKMDILEARIRNLIEEKQRRISRFSRQMEIEPSEVTITTIDQKLMSRILECIEKNMDNADYSVEELSSDIGMHRRNLSAASVSSVPPGF